MNRTPRVFVGATTVHVHEDGCGHCLLAASHAVARLPGVRSVTVNDAFGTVTVHAAGPVDLTEVFCAVQHTGHSCGPVR